jgi:hypothetical protein
MLRMAAAVLSVAIVAAVDPALGQTAGGAGTEQSTQASPAEPETQTEPAADGMSGAAPEGADAAAAAAEPAPDLLTGEEIDALTAPVALYPDPLLELTLQATIFPLQAVQAVRFLEKHAKDPSLQPDPEWDESILGLLNYPVVLQAMNADLEWTEALGNAVLNQLDDVQDSIQQFRSQLYAGGVLKSDDKQRVIVSNDVIAILPADAEVIFVPQYDPAAFAPPTDTSAEMAALAPAEGTEAEPAVEPAPAEELATEPAADVAAAAPPPEYQTAAVGTEAAPVYTSQPVYATAPPVAYSDPYPSFWSSAATFLGGAAVGGLVGYAIGDDDDDDDDDCCDFDEDDFDFDEDDFDGDFDGGGNNWSKDVNIEDSNIVINRDDDIRDNPNVRADQLPRNNAQAELRKRQGQGQTTASNRRNVQTAGTAPVRNARPAQSGAQSAALKNPSAQKKAATKPVGKRPGDTQVKRADAGALSGAKQASGKQVKAESRRGSQSRAVAQNNKGPTKQAKAQKRPQGGAALSKPKSSKQQVTRQSNRGKSSGGGKKRRG